MNYENQFHTIRKNNESNRFSPSDQTTAEVWEENPYESSQQCEANNFKELDTDTFKKMRQTRWPKTESHVKKWNKKGKQENQETK